MTERELVEVAKLNGFRLGGSRRMAEKFPAHISVHETTDWDIYCDNSQQSINFLNEQGFIKVEAADRSYWDDLLLDIYKHPQLKIEALIRSDKNLYSTAFESISVGEYIDKLWKSAPYGCAFVQEQICQYFNNLFVKTKGDYLW